jgi:hypothetical protein
MEGERKKEIEHRSGWLWLKSQHIGEG